MAIVHEQENMALAGDRRQKPLRLMEAADSAAGILGAPTVTSEELRARMEAGGIRPEDNIASAERIRMRYPNDSEGSGASGR